MRSYTVKAGDTLEGISIKFLYRSALAYKIKQINNLPDSNVYPGMVLSIPDAESNERKTYDGLKIVIDGYELLQTPPIKIITAINTIAPGFDFSLPIDQALKGIVKPYGFEKIDLYFDNSIILSGYISSVTNSTKDQKTKTIKGFGKSQLLSEVNFPVSSYPRTFYNWTLNQIFKKFCDLYNIPFDIEDDAKKQANEKFTQVEIDPEQKISDFLIELATTKGLIVYGNNLGGITLKKECVKSDNILKLENYPGEITFDTAGVFSDITCLKNYDAEGNTQVARAKLKLNEFKSKVFTIGKMQTESMKNILDFEKKTQLINSMPFSLDLPYVTDINGKLIELNKQIYYKNDDLELDGDFLIKGVTYEFTDKDQGCTIDLIPVKFLKGDFTF
jgi:LysM repeat protein